MDVDWNTIAKLSREAFRVAVNEWIGRARIQGGKVSGSSALLTPGSLTSDTNIEMRMLQILSSSQIPRGVSAALAEILAAAWNDWANGFRIQLRNAYPSFVAIPGHAAPPTRAVAEPPLSEGSSTGEASLKAPFLSSKLSSALRIYVTKGQESPDQAMDGLAIWVEGSFTDWKNLTKLVGISGKGQAPTFAPPYVPVAPVTSGVNVSVGSPFAGARFGKIVL
jgi:hypothetical protein